MTLELTSYRQSRTGGCRERIKIYKTIKLALMAPPASLCWMQTSLVPQRRHHDLSEMHCTVWEEGMDNGREWRVLGMNWM